MIRFLFLLKRGVQASVLVLIGDGKMSNITIRELLKKNKERVKGFLNSSSNIWTNKKIICENDSNLKKITSMYGDVLEKEKFYNFEFYNNRFKLRSETHKKLVSEVKKFLNTFDKKIYSPATPIMLAKDLPLTGRRLSGEYVIALANKDNLTWIDIDYYDYLTDHEQFKFYIKGSKDPVYGFGKSDFKSILMPVIGGINSKDSKLIELLD